MTLGRQETLLFGAGWKSQMRQASCRTWFGDHGCSSHHRTLSRNNRGRCQSRGSIGRGDRRSDISLLLLPVHIFFLGLFYQGSNFLFDFLNGVHPFFSRRCGLDGGQVNFRFGASILQESVHSIKGKRNMRCKEGWRKNGAPYMDIF